MSSADDRKPSADEPNDAAHSLAIGAVVGSYRIGEPIGSGGIANVHKAVDVRTGQHVALKTLRSDRAGTTEVVARFIREGRALQRLDHPNIVRVFDHGRTPQGGAWLAMELLDGLPLSSLLRRGPLAQHRALKLMTGIAKALAVVHGRAMVHRDIKPENIFVVHPGTPTEDAKLIDFGIAHVTASDLGEDSVEYTNFASLLGSVAFMAPEQLDGSGRRATSATDVYAFGISLYEALTGRLPFAGSSVREQVRARLSAAIVPLHEARRGARFSEALDGFFQRTLALDPDDRPRDGFALVDELEALRAGAFEPSPTPSSSRRSEAFVDDGIATALEGAPLKQRAPYMLLLDSFRHAKALLIVLTVVVAVGFAFAAAAMLRTPNAP